MKYLSYKENKKHGTFNFPIAFYHEFEESPRYNMDYHWHPEFEIIKIISGAFPMVVESNSMTFHKGDIIFIQSGFRHGGKPKDCVYEGIIFDMNILLKDNNICSKTIQDIINNDIVVNCLLNANSTNINIVFDSILNTFYKKNNGYEFYIQGYLYCLIGIIIQEHLYDLPYILQSDIKNINRNISINSIKVVLEYIATHYQEKITLNELAHIAGMNSKYFCRYFHSLAGRTPIDYVNYYRIEVACEQLTAKNTSIQQVAISCGFNTESYFIKIFKKYKNLTPKQYLKSCSDSLLS